MSTLFDLMALKMTQISYTILNSDPTAMFLRLQQLGSKLFVGGYGMEFRFVFKVYLRNLRYRNPAKNERIRSSIR